MKFKRVFILSPAHCGGERARLVFNDRAGFELALKLRSAAGATIGETFSFLSGLYFRGKAAYVQAFSDPPRALPRALVITTNRGLAPIDELIRISDLRAMGAGDIDTADPGYRNPLQRDARNLAAALGPAGRAILLGSIASGKYCDILLEAFGPRLLFPQEFVGRGDMSRGGLMLRCVDARRELTYVPVHGAVRRGSRPQRLQRRVRT